MIYFLGALFFLFAFLLIAVILLQEGKGGGLAAMSGAATDSVMGAKNPMRKITVYLFIGFIVIIISLNILINRDNSVKLAPGLTPDIPGMSAPVKDDKEAAPAEDKGAAEKAPTDVTKTAVAVDTPKPAEAATTAPAAPVKQATPATENK